MRTIHPTHPQDFQSYNTQQIRERYLLDKLVQEDKIESAYTHYDRMIIGAANPVNTTLSLETDEQLKSDFFFLSRRKIG